MKYLLITILLFFGVQVIQGQDFKKYAVVVGCSDYMYGNIDLRYSDDDAYRMYAYLKSPEGGALPDENIAVLVDEAATKSNILKTMDDIFSKASEGDMLLFFFSGHGSDGAFCPIDITQEYSTLLLHSEVKAVFKKYPAKYKLCLADACYSGSIYHNTPVTPVSQASSIETNVVIIMSSKPTETSQENPKIRQGAFTYYLLKGLKGSADRNDDHIVTLEELFPYVKANVLNLTKNAQTPVIEGNASRYMPVGEVRHD